MILKITLVLLICDYVKIGVCYNSQYA